MVIYKLRKPIPAKKRNTSELWPSIFFAIIRRKYVIILSYVLIIHMRLLSYNFQYYHEILIFKHYFFCFLVSNGLPYKI